MQVLEIMKTKAFSAKIENLYDMLEFVSLYARSKNIPAETLNKIILATEEALVNIIDYSYPNLEGTIEIICQSCTEKPGINVTLKDYGIPFNPIAQSPQKNHDSPPIPHLDENKRGGYGIYIFVGVMDHVEYKRLENGNLLSLTKYL